MTTSVHLVVKEWWWAASLSVSIPLKGLCHEQDRRQMSNWCCWTPTNHENSVHVRPLLFSGPHSDGGGPSDQTPITLRFICYSLYCLWHFPFKVCTRKGNIQPDKLCPFLQETGGFLQPFTYKNTGCVWYCCYAPLK